MLLHSAITAHPERRVNDGTDGIGVIDRFNQRINLKFHQERGKLEGLAYSCLVVLFADSIWHC